MYRFHQEFEFEMEDSKGVPRRFKGVLCFESLEPKKYDFEKFAHLLEKEDILGEVEDAFDMVKFCYKGTKKAFPELKSVKIFLAGSGDEAIEYTESENDGELVSFGVN